MNTFIFNNKNSAYTSVSNTFIENYMPEARGEYVKIYILGLKYSCCGEPGVSSSVIAQKLDLLESDVLNAWMYWNDKNVIRLKSLNNGSYSIEFLNLNREEVSSESSINLLEELNNKNIKDMLKDIEKLLGRTLSSKEITMYLSWQKDFNFSPEMILLLIQYCASKNKTDYRYIEKIAISWFDNNIKTVDDAQMSIKSREDTWVKINQIRTYLGMSNSDMMKPQEDLLNKWINTYKFQLNIIYKACDICFQRLSKTDFKYIDAILGNWFKANLTTLEDIEKHDINTKPNYKKYGNNNSSSSKGNFTNYEQRTYDFATLEKKLLGWDNND
ncbi:DnaD and phage-associated domain-containing protein [Hathewaya proteolytica DSM 3090]|uniref:DnaD and phage-associated domain-containing protein n=1 Tax=Hathewaya proteolytica DSM 3090 TaxID=1121331 RepID=A0A1M6MQH2_9CLOT|nr:DnaD domain protein [Hathewaya proteolytica]SHJ85748.1 DnaD and phage-associated domain-containing protein [Hathewaya proteolytica DSM 3090]